MKTENNYYPLTKLPVDLKPAGKPCSVHPNEQLSANVISSKITKYQLIYWFIENRKHAYQQIFKISTIVITSKTTKYQLIHWIITTKYSRKTDNMHYPLTKLPVDLKNWHMEAKPAHTIISKINKYQLIYWFIAT